MQLSSVIRPKAAFLAILAGSAAYSQNIITTAVGTTSVQFPQTALPAVNAPLESVTGVAIDKAGNLYISDARANLVLKVDATGTLTVAAGNGNPAFSGDGGAPNIAALNGPQGLAVDGSGNLYIADSGNNRVRKVSSGTITTIAGNGTA